jgi:hypothetical protein
VVCSIFVLVKKNVKREIQATQIGKKRERKEQQKMKEFFSG